MLDDLYFTFVNGGTAAPKLLTVPSGTTAGGVYMAKLGDYTFGLDTAAFQQLQRDTAFRWASIKRIGREPALQFTGLDDDTIEMSGVIYPHFRGGLSQMSQMRAAATRGEALPLVYAFQQVGQYCGLWCIKNIREGRTTFLRDGTPRKIEFTVSLVYYGEDKTGVGAAIAIPAAIDFPIISELPIPPLFDRIGGELLDSAKNLLGLPSITTDSPISDVLKAAKSVAGVASAAASAANRIRAVSKGSLASLTYEMAQLIPPEVKAAAEDIIKSTGVVTMANRDVLAGAAVFAESASGIKRISAGLGTIMKEVQRGSIVNGGVIQAAATTLAAMEKTAGVLDEARIGAAAALKNIALHADHLAFAASESSGQAEHIADLINV